MVWYANKTPHVESPHIPQKLSAGGIKHFVMRHLHVYCRNMSQLWFQEHAWHNHGHPFLQTTISHITGDVLTAAASEYTVATRGMTLQDQLLTSIAVQLGSKIAIAAPLLGILNGSNFIKSRTTHSANSKRTVQNHQENTCWDKLKSHVTQLAKVVQHVQFPLNFVQSM